MGQILGASQGGLLRHLCTREMAATEKQCLLVRLTIQNLPENDIAIYTSSHAQAGTTSNFFMVFPPFPVSISPNHLSSASAKMILSKVYAINAASSCRFAMAEERIICFGTAMLTR